MNKKIKTFLYITLIFIFTALTAGTLLVHFSMLDIGKNAVSDYIKGDIGFFCVIIPSALILLILLFKFAKFVKRKKVQAKAFEIDTKDIDAVSTQYAVGKFLSAQQKRVDSEARRSANAAVRSTKKLAKTSSTVSAALKEHNDFLRTAYNGEANENKKVVKQLSSEARPIADKISKFGK
ncbi:MAG: hypothetical protein IJ779_00980 [Ruminococcus sp.]|nr:hypothetical protein [Ruminococcus sp.]